MGILTLLSVCSNLNALITENEKLMKFCNLYLFVPQFMATLNLSQVNIFDSNRSCRVLSQAASKTDRPKCKNIYFAEIETDIKY